MKSLLDMCSAHEQAYSLLFESFTPQKTKYGVFWELDYLKWYDSFPCVSAIEEWMSDMTDEREDEYAFYRMGEEFGDTEERGNSEHFCFYPQQHVEVDFEALDKDRKVEV
tara:strand:- start:746 stop:1075 length:330 start_codon:yes stop_codon:yes gene_type:complete